MPLKRADSWRRPADPRPACRSPRRRVRSDRTCQTLQRYTGTCIQVIDGDSLNVQHIDGVARLRLARVRAPERTQFLGWRAAKALLERLVLNRVVSYVVTRDIFGRLIAEVSVGTVNANDFMRAAGYTSSGR